jgi:hypothetical protein
MTYSNGERAAVDPSRILYATRGNFDALRRSELAPARAAAAYIGPTASPVARGQPEISGPQPGLVRRLRPYTALLGLDSLGGRAVRADYTRPNKKGPSPQHPRSPYTVLPAPLAGGAVRIEL